eukprot:gene36740-3028_t
MAAMTEDDDGLRPAKGASPRTAMVGEDVGCVCGDRRAPARSTPETCICRMRMTPAQGEALCLAGGAGARF